MPSSLCWPGMWAIFYFIFLCVVSLLYFLSSRIVFLVCGCFGCVLSLSERFPYPCSHLLFGLLQLARHVGSMCMFITINVFEDNAILLTLRKKIKFAIQCGFLEFHFLSFGASIACSTSLPLGVTFCSSFFFSFLFG